MHNNPGPLKDRLLAWLTPEHVAAIMTNLIASLLAALLLGVLSGMLPISTWLMAYLHVIIWIGCGIMVFLMTFLAVRSNHLRQRLVWITASAIIIVASWWIADIVDAQRCRGTDVTFAVLDDNSNAPYTLRNNNTVVDIQPSSFVQLRARMVVRDTIADNMPLTCRWDTAALLNASATPEDLDDGNCNLRLRIGDTDPVGLIGVMVLSPGCSNGPARTLEFQMAQP